MRKQSIKVMADGIIARKIEQWRLAAAIDEPEKKFDTVHFDLKMNRWIDTVAAIEDAKIQKAIRGDTTLDIDGYAELPGNLQIIKSQFTAAIAAAWVRAYDKKKSHHIPVDKLFQPSLFPTLVYEEVRTSWLVIGDSLRVQLGDATNNQWRLNDSVKDENHNNQVMAFQKEKALRPLRERLFREHPDCGNTDALMKTLGAWRR